MIDEVFLSAYAFSSCFYLERRGTYCIVVFVYSKAMGLNCVSRLLLSGWERI
jgi:hypothetical protein